MATLLSLLDGIMDPTLKRELKTMLGSMGTADLTKLAATTATYTELNVLHGATATSTDLVKLHGVTATLTEMNVLHGATATSTDLTKLHGVTATSTALSNVLAAVTSGYKFASGTAAVTTSLEVATGLAGVSWSVCKLKDDPNITADFATIAASTTAGNILVKTWQPTATNNGTPIAATKTNVNVDWMAVGT